MKGVNNMTVELEHIQALILENQCGVDDITVQLNRAGANFKEFGEKASPNWLVSAKHALRMKTKAIRSYEKKAKSLCAKQKRLEHQKRLDDARSLREACKQQKDLDQQERSNLKKRVRFMKIAYKRLPRDVYNAILEEAKKPLECDV